MNKFDFEQLKQSAKEANLADYFLNSGYTTERHGSEIYVKEFPGLCVNENSNKWYNHYESVGGSNAIDCLVKICGHDFNQAVFELTGRDISSEKSSHYPQKLRPQFTSPTQKPNTILKEKKELKMPDYAENMRRVFAYFCQSRKIPVAVVEELAHANLLYQSSEKFKTIVDGIPQTIKNNNAVFVHTNENGEAIGGEVQGINSFKRYKGAVAGTGDSVFMYTPFPAADGKIKTAYLFESAIDLMSFYAFCKPEKMKGAVLISMAGLKPSVPKQLQERGIKVFSCVDNDDEGRKFEIKNGFARPKDDLLIKLGVKDWNDLIKLKIENPEAVKDFVPDIQEKKIINVKNIFTRKRS